MAKGDARHLSIATAPGIAANRHTIFRVASVSKLVVGQAIATFVKNRAIGWETDICDVLGWKLRHPSFPDLPVTLGMVASHSAGLTDDAGYIIPPDVSLQKWCTAQPVFATQPGTHFDYANLNYLILAEALECLSGLPFPEAIAPHLPNPGGFNWHGVPAEQAINRLPTYRSNAGDFEAQIDTDIAPIAVSRNVGAYSPQGGLRTSLAGMLQLAERLRDADKTTLWTPSMGAGNYLSGLFECYGPGLQIYHQPRFFPHALVGHFGSAYGFKGGVWYDAETGISFAYALNGYPIGDEDDDFSLEELRIFEAIAAV